MHHFLNKERTLYNKYVPAVFSRRIFVMNNTILKYMKICIKKKKKN